MTKNDILNMIRDKKNLVSINYVNAQSEIPDKSDFVRNIEQDQINSILHKGINQLPPQKKEVCRLKIENKKTNQEIADKIGISVHTVK